jgi:RNA polymerase sigma-70 factor (ECF subfamily)
VADGGLHDEVRPEVARDGAGLGRRLDDDELVCHDAYRQQRSRGRDGEVEFDEARDGHQQLQPDPGELLEAKNDAERLWCAIRSLEPTFRIPLVLFDIEGLPYEQIARIEGVPVGTVRSRLSRARERLGQILTESEAPGTFSPRVPSPQLSLAK